MIISVSCISSKEKKRHGPTNHTRVHIALKKFFSRIDWSKMSRPTQYVTLTDAQNRVLSNDLYSHVNLPPFLKVEMDGYAVRSDDTRGASIKHPTLLEFIGRLTAGQNTHLTIEPGKTAAVATGSRVPKGANAVVMIEHAHLQDNTVQIFKRVECGENITLKGQDVKNGQILLKKGTWLTSQDLGLIASIGLGKVPVYKRPVVAVFSTGDELTEPGSKLDDACIFESNRYMISSMVKEFGGEVVDLGICKDDRDAILYRLKKALKFDMVVVSGGASVGEKDYLPDLIKKLGKPGLIVHRIAMKPGSPTGLGIVNYKPIIISPGFPVSSFVAFYTFGRPLLLRILKTEGLPESKLTARMAADINEHKFRRFVRVNVVKQNGSHWAKPVSVSDAGLLSTLTKSNGIVIMEDGSRLMKGEIVDVILLRNVYGVSN